MDGKPKLSGGALSAWVHSHWLLVFVDWGGKNLTWKFLK